VAGSLRRPASACGLTTIIGTAGRVSARGILSSNRDCDHVGPLARTAKECALLLGAIAGRDPRDVATHGSPPVGALPAVPSAADRPLAGRRIGVVRLDPAVALDPTVAEVFERFQRELRALGAQLVAVRAPRPLPVDGRPRSEEVAFHRRHFVERGNRYTPYTRAHAAAMLERAEGTGALPAHGDRAARRRYRAAWRAVTRGFALDALALPAQTEATPPLPRPGDGGDLDGFGDRAIRSMWNSAGMPVVCVPAGSTTQAGLPVGAQLAGAPWSEPVLLQLAIDYQSGTEHHRRVARHQSTE
jgi:aspartyl-tRNA(Asn)/glutamyl-tRNA(Gln) amidotransferase subunit A